MYSYYDKLRKYKLGYDNNIPYGPKQSCPNLLLTKINLTAKY